MFSQFSSSFDDDSKMTTTDSCSYNTPGSINGWHSPDTSSSFHNGAISKNSYHNGFQDLRNDKDNYSIKSDKDYRNDRDEERCSRSPKNINLTNGMKNVNISNGVIPKKLNRQSSADGEVVNGHSSYERKGAHSSPSHNSNSYEGSPNKSKVCCGDFIFHFTFVTATYWQIVSSFQWPALDKVHH